MEYAIGIVTYQPDLARLEENLKAAADNLQTIGKDQQGAILIADNGSEQVADIQQLAQRMSIVTLIQNSTNLGIAAALNQLCRKAVDLGYEWLVTLDQDSVIQSGMLEAFCRYTDQSDVAIICPRIEDRHLGRQHTQQTSGTEYIGTEKWS